MKQKTCRVLLRVGFIIAGGMFLFVGGFLAVAGVRWALWALGLRMVDDVRQPLVLDFVVAVILIAIGSALAALGWNIAIPQPWEIHLKYDPTVDKIVVSVTTTTRVGWIRVIGQAVARVGRDDRDARGLGSRFTDGRISFATFQEVEDYIAHVRAVKPNVAVEYRWSKGQEGAAINSSAARQILDELLPEERLLWSGRPRGGLRLEPGLSFLVVSLLIWSSLVFLDARANVKIAEGDLVLDVVAPTLMALTGYSTVVSLVVIQLWSRRRTVYGLSNRRAIIVGGFLRQKVESLPLQAMTTTNVVLRPRGNRGTIRFEDITCRCGDRERTLEFSRIEYARHVYFLIQNAIAHQREPWP